MADGIDELDIKLVILGMGGVGKTSLAKKFLEKNLSDDYIPTIGYNIFKKDYKLKINNKLIRINIWDTGGQKSFNPTNQTAFIDADAAFLVFDLSKPNETLRNFKKEYLSNLEKYSKRCQITIVGNKLDLIKDRNVLNDILRDNFRENDRVLLISAKTGENVSESFELIIYNFLRIIQLKISANSSNGMVKEYLNLIGKKEKQLNKLYVNPSNIKNLLKKKKAIIEHTENEPPLISIAESGIEYKFILEELERIEINRREIKQNFREKLAQVEEVMIYLRKSSTQSDKDSFNILKEQLIDIGKEFESNLSSIRELSKEKEFVLKAKSEVPLTPRDEIDEIPRVAKSEEESPKSKPSQRTDPQDLYQRYEDENPRRKAVWRGKETKGFLEWKKGLNL